jgi:aminomethyltransferase
MSKQTALYQNHLKLGGKIVDFNGWSLPLNYGSQITEHKSVREKVGIFDVSHMAPVNISGAEAHKFMQYLLANNIDKIAPGKAIYGCMLNTDGKIVDDLITYWLAENNFRVVFNAGCYEKDLAWVTEQAQNFDVIIDDISQDTAMIALQGPEAVEIVKQVCDNAADLLALKPFECVEYNGGLIGRTGYTGEDGFEFIIPNAQASDLFDKLVAAGSTPCGLGARDSLRLEAGMKLYGNDMDLDTTPFDAALGWTVALEPSSRDFIGRKALEQIKQQPTTQKMVGLTLLDKGVIRPGQEVITEFGTGVVTSGIFSPTLNKSIAYARVPAGKYTTCQINIRNKLMPANVGLSSFYKRPSN